MRHIDLVSNDWAAGSQALIAQITPLDSDVKISAASDRWTHILSSPISVGATTVNPSDGEVYVNALREKYAGGSYIDVWPEHDETACPFIDDPDARVKMQGPADLAG